MSSAENRVVEAPAAAPPKPARLSAGTGVGLALRIVLPLTVLAIFLLLWNYVPTWQGLPQFELPTFGEDIKALADSWGTVIGPNLEKTIVDALVGFAVGNILAIVGAVLFTQSKYVEWTFYPLAIMVQTIPIVVLAPLFVILLQVYGLNPDAPLPIIGIGSKPILLVTILITFFPTLVNMTVGLRAIDPNLYDLMRLLNANRLTILWRLRLPSSIPYLFSSFKITSTLCFVGAVVGEWMLASQQGLGGYLNVFYYENDIPELWAAVIAIVACSMAFFGIVVLAERILVPWRQER